MADAEKVFTLADLRAWTRREPSFAVLGRPIAHSLSPKMHNAALAAAARERSAPELAARRYFRFEIAPEELGEALPLFFEKNFLGLNLTIPHKVEALPLLKKISPEAAGIGAANTLARDDALGGWRGENTDGRGFALAAEMSLGVKLAGTRVVLLGAGGAARAIAATALARGCVELVVVNRSRDRAEALARALSGEATFQSLYENSSKEISLNRIPPSDRNVASPKNAPVFYNPLKGTVRSRANLPHWAQGETACFATFRLADSLPQEKLDALALERSAWMNAHPKPWGDAEFDAYRENFVVRVQKWLDANHGSCVLGERENREIVENALLHFDGDRYRLYAFVVMPNHVHVLFAPLGENKIPEILRSWKGFCAREINRRLGSSGTLWQKESWDTLIRDGTHFARVMKYMCCNSPELFRNMQEIPSGETSSGEATFQSLYGTSSKEISLNRIPPSDRNVASPKISVLSPDEIRDFRAGGKTLVVNATPLGLRPGDPSPFPPELFRDGFAAYDTTYGAHVPALVAAARGRGVPAADGRAMLAWQGALAFELWNGVPAADAFPVMFAALS
ncbi:MAG: transposase [Candidatus Spyradosoma sp.]